jgi:NAD(P)H-dependent FMN reductase
VLALGRTPTALVNAIDALSKSGQKFVPNILVTGGGGTIEGLAAQLMGVLETKGPKDMAGVGAATASKPHAEPSTPEAPKMPPATKPKAEPPRPKPEPPATPPMAPPVQ